MLKPTCVFSTHALKKLDMGKTLCFRVIDEVVFSLNVPSYLIPKIHAMVLSLALVVMSLIAFPKASSVKN